MTRSAVRALFVAASLAVTAAACGSDDPSSSDSDSSDSIEAVDTAAPADTGAPTDPIESSDTTSDREAAAFPVTIDHKFGETTIDAEPERVVSIGYNEHDFLLALGVVPVALRDWYGEQPNSVWPWAQDELGDATPEVLPATDLNFEQIAALEPDLIVGVWSGISAEDYELLSAIAPTVAQPGEYDDYGTPWQEQTLILGEATGRSAEAEAIVADVEGQITAAREAHPEWEGQTSSVSFVTEEGPGAYASQDIRSRFMQDLGFVIPEINDSDDANSFYLQLSAEDITALDVDVLVWVIGTVEALDGILDQLPTRTSLNAYAEGREIFADIELSGAFSHSSPLSLEFVLDAMVPEIEAAADGDPSTPVPSAVAVGAAARCGGAGRRGGRRSGGRGGCRLGARVRFDGAVRRQGGTSRGRRRLESHGGGVRHRRECHGWDQPGADRGRGHRRTRGRDLRRELRWHPGLLRSDRRDRAGRRRLGREPRRVLRLHVVGPHTLLLSRATNDGGSDVLEPGALDLAPARR